MEKLVITIRKSCKTANIAIHEYKDNTEVVTCKSMDLSTVLQVLSNSAENPGTYRLGSLPNGYVDASIYSECSGFKCIVQVPQAIRPFLYYDKYYVLPIPSLLFYFDISNTKCVKGLVYCYIGELNNDTKLYNYPFGNVSTEGKICWGENKLIIEKLADVNTLVDTFMASSTNDDYWEANIKLESEDYTDKRLCVQRGLIEFLDNKTSFPENILKKAYLTLGDIRNYL